jgi:hypothetical protein
MADVVQRLAVIARVVGFLRGGVMGIEMRFRHD